MKRFISWILSIALLLALMPTGLFGITANAATSEFAGGSGTESDPYLVSNSTHLNNVRYYLDAHFKLTSNIHLYSSNWSPIGSTSNESFAGTFDGNGFVIEILEIACSAKGRVIAGLFGYNEGVIKNLCISGGEVYASGKAVSSNTSSESYAGGIAAYNKGTIMNCYNSATISASASGCGPMSYAGGITGYNTGIITDCYNEGKVRASASDTGAAVTSSARAEVGGIAGSNRNSIECCYNISTVSRTVDALDFTYGNLGGIVGGNGGRTTNCYYMDIVEKTGSSGGKRCTAEQLEQQSTYVGFDFENVWILDTSIQPYPFLRTTHCHIYENACDSICNDCGCQRTPPHSYEWIVDKENNCGVDGSMHEECANCHVRQSENTKIEATGNHIFADTKDTECDICRGTYYQITFDSNGGTSIKTIITLPGVAVTLPSKPARNGYVFVGWATTKNGNAIYQPNKMYSAGESIILYAQWNRICTSCDGEGFFECSSCGGDGTLYCTTCSGSGKTGVCNTCSGTGNESYDCGVCDGSGKVKSPINCSKCSGYGWTCNDCGRGVSLLGRCSCGSSSKYYCSKCGGSSANNWVPCTHCNGTGTRTKICSDCYGNKVERCSSCGGDGSIYHSSCNGTGKLTCTKCNGTGEVVRTNVEAPAVPTLKSITANSVILNTITNGEYSIDGTNWQDSPIFENLETGKEYSFFQRYAKTDTTYASESSIGLTIVPDHIYDNTCDTECNLCGYVRTITHSYVWYVDQDATCSRSGIKHEECSVCHAKQNEGTIILATGEHTFDNACDTKCNACGYIRQVSPHFIVETVEEHVLTNSTTYPFTLSDGWYSSTNKSDSTSSTFTLTTKHDCELTVFYKVSSEQNYDKLIIKQNSTTLATASGTVSETSLTVILVAGDVLTFTYSKDRSQSSGSDVAQFKLGACDCDTYVEAESVAPSCVHPIVCAGCGLEIKPISTVHTYDNVCDTTCNKCGFVRTAPHEYDHACDTTCNECGYVRAVPDHVYDDEKDRECNECGYVAYISGDLTGDDKINSLDGLLLMRYLNGWNVNIASTEAMDVNGDGRVNSLDGLILMRYLNGWNVTLG